MMAFERLTYTKSWKDAEAFPTYEPDESKVRADLQLLHDEAKEGINRLVDALNASTAAAQLPFAPVEGMTAQTVQAAIEEVFSSVVDTATGKITNGSVTKEKLAAEVLKRVYGGRVWVSLDLPTDKECPETDFPVGQLWLRPACKVKNIVSEQWKISGGVVEAKNQGWVFTTDGTQDFLTASQELDAIGAAGERVLVRLKAGEADTQVNQLALYLNGLEYEIEANVWHEAELDEAGGLEIQINAEWPDMQEGRQIEITSLVAVNIDALERDANCGTCKDWPERLDALGNFDETQIPMEILMQTAEGQWEKIWQKILPVSRGGTGLAKVEQGALLYGTNEDKLGMLPAVEKGILQWSQGVPHMLTPEAFAQKNLLAYILTGQYVGNGGVITGEKEEQISVELNIPKSEVPFVKLLVIYPNDGSCDTAVVANGGRHSGEYSFYDGVLVTYQAWVSLKGNVLTFSNDERGNYKEQMVSCHLNAKDVTYSWIAICGGVPTVTEPEEEEKDEQTTEDGEQAA